MRTRYSITLAILAVDLSSVALAQAETVVRYRISMADIPLTSLGG